MSVSPSSSLAELKEYISKHGLEVSAATGGKSGRTIADIYQDIVAAEKKAKKKLKKTKADKVTKSGMAMEEGQTNLAQSNSGKAKPPAKASLAKSQDDGFATATDYAFSKPNPLVENVPVIEVARQTSISVLTWNIHDSAKSVMDMRALLALLGPPHDVSVACLQELCSESLKNLKLAMKDFKQYRLIECKDSASLQGSKKKQRNVLVWLKDNFNALKMRPNELLPFDPKAAGQSYPSADLAGELTKCAFGPVGMGVLTFHTNGDTSNKDKSSKIKLELISLLERGKDGMAEQKLDLAVLLGDGNWHLLTPDDKQGVEKTAEKLGYKVADPQAQTTKKCAKQTWKQVEAADVGFYRVGERLVDRWSGVDVLSVPLLPHESDPKKFQFYKGGGKTDHLPVILQMKMILK